MVTQVTLGNFFSLNGKTVLGGTGGSGLDTQALIKSLTEAKSAPIKADQDLISVNDKQTAALSQFNTLLSDFRSATDALRNPPGVGNAADNAFQFTTANIISPGSNYFSVTTSAGAAIQSYNIKNISSVASAATQGTGSFQITSGDDNVVPPALGAVAFGAGTITVNGHDITIASGDSLNGIAAKFNAVSNLTGISATVIQVDSSHFKLSFVATDTGDTHNFDLSTAVDPSGVLTSVGLTAATAGTNADFYLNNIHITRQSNTVSDVVNGLTFNILQTTPDAVTPYTVNIKPDTSVIQSAINNFINTYNAIKTFEAQQVERNSDGSYKDTAVLSQNQTFLTLMRTINAEVTSQVGGITGNNPSSLVDVGVTFTKQPASDKTPEVDNILTVNDGQLTSALTSNFTGVKKLFGFNLTSDNANLTIFKHSNALATSSFVLSINPGSGTFNATYDLGSGPQTVAMTAKALSGGVDGYTLTGPDGSALEGLELIYASTATATINVTATQGISDKLFNTTDTAMNTTNGSLSLEAKRIDDNTKKLNTDIDALNLQITTFQQQLVTKFSALEQAISRVNSLLQSLAANDTQRYIQASR